AAIADAVAPVAPVEPVAAPDVPEQLSPAAYADLIPESGGVEYADSVARVSQALSSLLGPQSSNASMESLFELPSFRVGQSNLAPAPKEEREPTEDELRRERLRAAAAAELAAAHALAEEERQRAESGDLTAPVAPVVDLGRRRRDAKKAEEEARQAEEA